MGKDPVPVPPLRSGGDLHGANEHKFGAARADSSPNTPTTTRTSHRKAPQTPLEPGGCLMQLSRDPRALSLQNAFWFSLGCCTFFLIPNIIFAIRLTKHFRPIRNRLM